MSTVPEMDGYENEAKEWAKCSPLKFKTFRDDSENMLKMSLEGETIQMEISITCPTSTDGKFTVMSECQDFLSYLSVVIDYCDSAREKTLTMILDKMGSAVQEFLSKTANTEEDDDDDDDEGYDFDEDNYYGNDADADNDTQEVVKKEDSDDDDMEETFFGSRTNPAAFQRLATDLKNMRKEAHKFGILGSPRGDNLFLWDVKLTGFDKETKLGQDIENFAQKYKREPMVYLEMQFPGEYPMLPPFVRVIRPRFKFLTGHVTIGGSICMQMLTRSGWTPSNDIESILVQIRSEIMSDPNARLDSQPDREYTEAEARDAFNRMVSRYGW